MIPMLIYFLNMRISLILFCSLLYGAQEALVNLDSARQSQIEELPSERGGPSPRGKGDEEDRFDEVADSPNSQNLTERRISYPQF